MQDTTQIYKPALDFQANNFANAYKTLKSAFDYYQALQGNQYPHIIEALKYDGIILEDSISRSRDAVIQRFQYTLETFWKYLKAFLESTTGSSDLTGSRNVVREAVKVRAITEEQGSLLLKMIEMRNLTSHIYRLEVAQMIEAELPSFVDLLGKLKFKA